MNQTGVIVCPCNCNLQFYTLICISSFLNALAYFVSSLGQVPRCRKGQKSSILRPACKRSFRLQFVLILAVLQLCTRNATIQDTDSKYCLVNGGTFVCLHGDQVGKVPGKMLYTWLLLVSQPGDQAGWEKEVTKILTYLLLCLSLVPDGAPQSYTRYFAGIAVRSLLEHFWAGRGGRIRSSLCCPQAALKCPQTFVLHQLGPIDS